TTARVASGVTSSGVSPVPPVVNTKALPASTCARSRSAIASASSGTTSVATTSAPASAASSASRGPETSSPWPRASEVETVITAASMARSLGGAAPVLLTAGLLEQRQLDHLHAPLQPLDHVVDRQRGHAGRRHRLHLDAGLGA